MDCQSGRTEAFDALVSRWQKRLWSHAYRMVGDTEAAWDITQQSWIGIIKGLRKLNDPANFKAWAYRITTNKSIDWIGKRKAERNIRIEDVHSHQHEQKTDAEINELMDKLDIEKKTILCLYYFEQFSVSEISAALKIPAGTVKSRLHNARNELRELWQRHCE